MFQVCRRLESSATEEKKSLSIAQLISTRGSGAFEVQSLSTEAAAGEQEVTSEYLNKVLVALEEDLDFGEAKCGIQIKNLCRSDNVSATAILLKSIRSKRIFLRSEAYKLLLTSIAETKKFEVASWAFKDLVLTTVSPDLSYFIDVTKAFQDSEEDQLHQFIKEVAESTFPRGTTVLNEIILDFAKAGQADKALQIFEDIKSLKCKPDVVTYNAVQLSLVGTRKFISNAIQL